MHEGLVLRCYSLLYSAFYIQEFVVDEILADHGNHHRRSIMEFLVRFAGYDERSNSWEPYKVLMHVDKLHDCLREHKMRALIPREKK